MKREEGRPYRQAEGAPQSTRTTQQPSTTSTAAHHPTPAEAALYHLAALPFALAVVAAGCALLWLVWP